MSRLVGVEVLRHDGDPACDVDVVALVAAWRRRGPSLDVQQYTRAVEVDGETINLTIVLVREGGKRPDHDD